MQGTTFSSQSDGDDRLAGGSSDEEDVDAHVDVDATSNIPIQSTALQPATAAPHRDPDPPLPVQLSLTPNVAFHCSTAAAASPSPFFTPTTLSSAVEIELADVSQPLDRHGNGDSSVSVMLQSVDTHHLMGRMDKSESESDMSSIASVRILIASV